MQLRRAEIEEYGNIRGFYWEVIDLMQGKSNTVGWKKGIYPSDSFIRESLECGELYVLELNGRIAASVILNSRWNEGYEGLPWSIDCIAEEVLVPHALAVHPSFHRQGIGRQVVDRLLDIARSQGKKTVRLDILNGNEAALKLYTGAGFQFVQSKQMFYEDTGWTEFLMYELIL